MVTIGSQTWHRRPVDQDGFVKLAREMAAELEYEALAMTSTEFDAMARFVAKELVAWLPTREQTPGREVEVRCVFAFARNDALAREARRAA